MYKDLDNPVLRSWGYDPFEMNERWFLFGFDPSFTGFGIAKIDFKNPFNKKINLDEISTDFKGGKFKSVVDASEDLVDKVLYEYPEAFSHEAMTSQEIPPTYGYYTTKLWVLGAHLFKALHKKALCFSTSYLSFIHGKRNKKEDTIALVEEILALFEQYGYKVEIKVSETKKSIKMTSNEADAMLYATRLFIKSYQIENVNLVNSDKELAEKILELKPRFSENKEEFYD